MAAAEAAAATSAAATSDAAPEPKKAKVVPEEGKLPVPEGGHVY